MSPHISNFPSGISTAPLVKRAVARREGSERSMGGGKEWLEKGAKKLGVGKITKTQVRTFSQGRV